MAVQNLNPSTWGELSRSKRQSGIHVPAIHLGGLCRLASGLTCTRNYAVQLGRVSANVRHLRERWSYRACGMGKSIRVSQRLGSPGPAVRGMAPNTRLQPAAADAIMSRRG
jgi:hypothetical protein